MSQSTVCPNCRAKLMHKPTHVGKLLPCPKCGTKFVIADPASLGKTAAPIGSRLPDQKPIDRSRQSERAKMEWGKAQTPSSTEQAEAPLERWKIWGAIGASAAGILLVVAGIYIWIQSVTQTPPPKPAPPVVAARVAPAGPTPEEIERKLKTPNGIDLGGVVKWKESTPEPAKAAFVGDLIEGAGFKRWPIQLANVLSDQRLGELTGPHPTMYFYFLRCLWSDDESSALVMTSDEQIIQVDVPSRTIKSIITTQGLSDMAKCRGGWFIYQNSSRQGRRFVGPTSYTAVQLFNFIRLDQNLKVMKCLQGKFSHELGSSPQSTWIYTDQLALNLELGTIEEIAFEPGPEGRYNAALLRGRILSADGQSMYCRNDIYLERFRVNGAKLTWVERLGRDWSVSSDGLFLFRHQPNLEDTLTSFYANKPEVPITSFADPEGFGFKISADGRRILRYDFKHDDEETRADLLVIEPDRTFVIPIARHKPHESLPLGNFFISPSGRTALVAGNGSRPDTIFWLEINN